MTDPELVSGCLVALLIPHPSRTAVLVADVGRPTGESSASLPTVWLKNPEPELSDILGSVEVIDPDAVVVLRQVSIPAGEGKQNALMLEFDAYWAEPPIGLTWLDLDDETIARLEPSDLPTRRRCVGARTH